MRNHSRTMFMGVPAGTGLGLFVGISIWFIFTSGRSDARHVSRPRTSPNIELCSVQPLIPRKWLWAKHTWECDMYSGSVHLFIGIRGHGCPLSRPTNPLSPLVFQVTYYVDNPYSYFVIIWKHYWSIWKNKKQFKVSMMRHISDQVIIFSARRFHIL